MSKVVEVPGTGNVEFPDSMSDADIGQVITRQQLKITGPGMVNPPLPQELQPEGDGSLGRNLFLMPARGVRQTISGVERMAEPGIREKMGGASDVIRGAGKVAAPFAIGPIVANPIGALATGAAATGAGMAAKAGLGLAGAPPEAQELGSDVASIVAGGANLARPTPMRALGAGVKAAAPGVTAGGAMIGAGELVGKLPGMEWAGRWGLGYPGARKIGGALEKGWQSAREAFGANKALPRGEPAPGYSESNTSVEPPGPVSPPPKYTQPRSQPTTPKTPQQAASENAHVPGVTQADEFKPLTPQVQPPSPLQQQGPIPPTGPQPIIPPSGLTPKGGAISPQGPQTPNATEVIKPNTAPPNEPMLAPQETPKRDPALQALFDRYGERVRGHLEAIPKKEANIVAWAKESKIPVSELESLRDDLEQADDPAKYAKAIENAKAFARDIHAWGKDRGRDVPKDYRTFDLQDIETAIKALKSQLAPIPKP